MKSLSLFIDKWYIVGAVNDNGSTYPLDIPNDEDRIWLFFFEDVANNRISFGKNYEQSYYDKKPSYIGDVFTALNDPKAHFTRYSNRPEELKEIFSASGIFDLLKSSVGASDSIDVYLSFSVDIEDTSKLKFINELKEHDFNIVENVARISHLALEECRKRGKCNDAGHYIVLEATNENLHFSIYELNEGFYLRKAESVLPGYGYDVRRKALIEYVVENINRTTKLLNTQNEIAQEHKRMESFANQWLRKIANSRPGLPVALANITFSVAPNNPTSVIAIPKNLDQRTDGIVNEIVRKITEFIREAHLNTFDIKGIVFIGNTFTNEKFRSAINSRIIINDNSIELYREVEFPKIVSVYSQIDCRQFSNATTAFFTDAEKEAERKKLAHEEAEKRRKAEEAAERERQAKEATRRTEREYELAMENVSRYEAEKDYEQMSSWADIALSHKPNDPSATDKKEQALRLLATQKEAIRQYNTLMQRAKTCFEEKRWNDAIAQCDMALELNPDSPEARRIKKESKQQLDTKEKVANLITRVDFFMEKKLYAKAIEELDKIKSLQPDNQDAIERRKEIEQIYSAHNEAVQSLIDKFNSYNASGDYTEAIQVCEKLVELDSENTRKWMEKLNSVKENLRLDNELRERLTKLKNNIDISYNSKDWNSVIKYCEQYLSIKEDDNIKEILQFATAHFELEQINKYLSDVQDHLLNGNLEVAATLIDRALIEFPNNKEIIALRTTCSNQIKKLAKEIESLKDALDKAIRTFDFIRAIEICNSLLAIDKEHRSDWSLRLQSIQADQIKKNDLEKSFRRKKADIGVLLRNGDANSENEILSLRALYHKYGIVKFDQVFDELLQKANPTKYVNIQKKKKQKTPVKETSSDNNKIVESNKRQTQTLEQNDLQSEGFILLRRGQFREAKRIFATKEQNFQMSEICSRLIKLVGAKRRQIISDVEIEELNEIINKYSIKLI